MNNKKSKNRTRKCKKNLVRAFGSVCAPTNFTLKNKGLPYAGINSYNQINISDDREPLVGNGIQLWKGTTTANMEGYVKLVEWNNPKNFKIEYWKLDKLGGGILKKKITKF